jgi:hypothetical protein
MKILLPVLIFILGMSAPAIADVWMWIDATGNTHFVDTQTPIYAWTDEAGEIHYSDTPDDDNAISVNFTWYAAGTLTDLEPVSETSGPGSSMQPGETIEELLEREKAEAYYCKRATEIYDSYVNAPTIYRTTESGEREYLSKQEKAQTISDTRAQKEALCQ